jgi:hypothetical protein
LFIQTENFPVIKLLDIAVLPEPPKAAVDNNDQDYERKGDEGDQKVGFVLFTEVRGSKK